jgi:hypothetical protein
MKQRIFSAPGQHPGRVLVMLGDEVIAQGSLTNLAIISRALSTPAWTSTCIPTTRSSSRRGRSRKQRERGG